MGNVIYSIGHSNRTKEEFVLCLKNNGVRQLFDIRKLPGSRAFPQFDQGNMIGWLRYNGIEYYHLPLLGGRRSKGLGKQSPNGGWQNASFRRYADYMQSDDFKKGMDQAETLARSWPSAFMCAEAVYWQCHRRLVSDAFIAREWNVRDIMTPSNVKPHDPTKFACFHGVLNITYPPEQETDLLSDVPLM